MKTEQLIDLLATGAGAATGPAPAQRYAQALGWGTAGAALLMLGLLQVRADLLAAMAQPMFWGKLGFVASLAGAGLFAALRLSRPGARLDGVVPALLLPVLAMWAVAAVAWFGADAADRPRLFFGATWKTCPLLIALLSAPLFVAVMRAMQGLAPTRPRQAGFVAGLLAGAAAAVVYCLHCPEMAAPFVAFWYLLGMLIPAALGALLGRSLLRW